MDAKDEGTFTCEKGNAGFMVCTEKGCQRHPVICKDDHCSCYDPHNKHSQIRIRGFLERLSKPLLNKDADELNRRMIAIIDLMTDSVNAFRKKHQRHMELYAERHFPLCKLRQKLLAKEKPSEVLTGDVFARLLDEVENDQPISSPYRATAERLEQKYRKVDGELHDLFNRIEALWAFEFPVNIQTYQGKSTLYHFEPTNTVEELKTKIQSQEGYPLEQIKLTYKGKELENKKTLKDYDVGYKDSIYLGLRFRGILNIFVNTPQGRSISLKVESTDTVEKIKNRLQEKENIPVASQILTFAGVEMNDERTLSDYLVRNECMLTLTATETATQE